MDLRDILQDIQGSQVGNYMTFWFSRDFVGIIHKVGPIGIILRLYRDNGNENGNYYSILEFEISNLLVVSNLAENNPGCSPAASTPACSLGHGGHGILLGLLLLIHTGLTITAILLLELLLLCIVLVLLCHSSLDRLRESHDARRSGSIESGPNMRSLDPANLSPKRKGPKP